MKDQIRVLRAEAAALLATSDDKTFTANRTPEVDNRPAGDRRDCQRQGRRGQRTRSRKGVSALTPHIRVLRAEADALARGSRQTRNIPVAHLMMGLAAAKAEAADQLEAEDAALKTPRDGLDEAITYNPKGKTTK